MRTVLHPVPKSHLFLYHTTQQKCIIDILRCLINSDPLAYFDGRLATQTDDS